MTTEDFIKKAKEIHGDKYDYSKVEYVNPKTNVCIICSKHGEFWQKPYNHLSGSGCPECIRHTWTTEDFIKKAKEIHGDKYDYSKVEFINTRTKVCIICHDLDRNGKEIGEFWQLPLEHLNGHKYERERKGINEECWEERTCPICGNIFKTRKKHKKITCSEQCRLKYIQLHKEEIDSIRIPKILLAKQKYTEKEKEAIREKVRKTCLERYGVDSYTKTPESRKMLSIKMKEQKKQWDEENRYKTLIPKYTKICEDDNLELLEFRSRFDCDVKCKTCGNIFNIKVLGYLNDASTKNLCRVCHPIEPIYGPTKIENELDEFLRENNILFYRNCRSVIAPKEIDFYLPDHNIGIEMDGLFWHSEIQKPRNYHIDKTNDCLLKGVKLIHIFEDEWMDKKEICKSRLKNLLNIGNIKIFARKCTISEINKEEYRNFITENHIQGYVPAIKCYGLYYNGELVSIMSFGKLRKNLGNSDKEGCYELLRFCNKLNTTVVGGASKLLKHFIETNNPNEIISYADRRWSNGNLYEKLGFKLDHITQPNYYYLVGGKRKNRFSFRKNVLVEKYNCPTNMSEHDFCLSQHWYRIYDCGNLCYKWNKEN